jgi:hypothetical protein
MGTAMHRNASVLAETEGSAKLSGAPGSGEAATPSEVARIGLQKAVHYLKLAANQIKILLLNSIIDFV